VFCNGDLLPFNPFIVSVVPGDLAYCKGTIAMNQVKDVDGTVSVHAGDTISL